MKDEHAQFSGSIPAAYDRYLGPILFQPYVSQEILGHIETPVVLLTEQHEIVRRVESLFALADQN
jgi:hypothetical protein